MALPWEDENRYSYPYRFPSSASPSSASPSSFSPGLGYPSYFPGASRIGDYLDYLDPSSANTSLGHTRKRETLDQMEEEEGLRESALNVAKGVGGAWNELMGYVGVPLGFLSEHVAEPALQKLVEATGGDKPQDERFIDYILRHWAPEDREGLLDYYVKGDTSPVAGLLPDWLVPERGGVARAALTAGTRFLGGMAYDPTIFAMGGLSKALTGVAKAARRGETLLQTIPEMARQTAKGAAAVAKAERDVARMASPLYKAGTITQRVLHPAFQASMGTGAVQGGWEAIQRAEEGDWPGATEAAVEAAGAAGMMAYPSYLRAKVKIAEGKARRLGREARAGSYFHPEGGLPTEAIPDINLRTEAHEKVLEFSKVLAENPGFDRNRLTASLPAELQPYSEQIMAESVPGGISINSGRALIDRVRQLYGDRGPRGVTKHSVEDPKKGNYYLVQRTDLNGQRRVVGVAQVDGNSLTYIAGGKAMDSPISARDLYQAVDANGVKRGGYVSPFGYRARAKGELRTEWEKASAEMGGRPVTGRRPELEEENPLTELVAGEPPSEPPAEDQAFAALRPGRKEYGETGFYSRLQELFDPVASPKTQGVMPADQWIKFLSDVNRGIKRAELEDTGLLSWLQAKRNQKVRREEIAKYLDDNRVEVKETLLSERPVLTPPPPLAWAEASENLPTEGRLWESDSGRFIIREEETERGGGYRLWDAEREDWTSHLYLPAAMEDAQTRHAQSPPEVRRPRTEGPRHRHYTFREGQSGIRGTYEEHLLQTPRREERVTEETLAKREEIEKEYDPEIESLKEAQNQGREMEVDWVRSRIEENEAQLKNQLQLALDDYNSEADVLGLKRLDLPDIADWDYREKRGWVDTISDTLYQTASARLYREKEAVIDRWVAAGRVDESGHPVRSRYDWSAVVDPAGAEILEKIRAAKTKGTKIWDRFINETDADRYDAKSLVRSRRNKLVTERDRRLREEAPLPRPAEQYVSPEVHFPQRAINVYVRHTDYWNPRADGPSVMLTDGSIARWTGKEQGVRGEKVLFLDEIQADRYNQLLNLRKKVRLAQKKMEEESLSASRVPGERITFGLGLSESLRYERDTYKAQAEKLEKSMPAVGDHARLAIQRMLKLAADGGYDRIAWSTGEMQKQFWLEALRKQVDKLAVRRIGNGRVELKGWQNSREVVNQEMNESDLENWTGETMATDIVSKLDIIDAKKEDPKRAPRMKIPNEVGPVEVQFHGWTEGGRVPATIPGHETNVPGLVLTREARIDSEGKITPVRNRWNVTHRASGTLVSPSSMTINEALRYVEKLSLVEGMNWTTGDLDRDMTSNQRIDYARIFQGGGTEELRRESVILTGREFDIGGGGRKTFYDDILVNEAKKWGGRAGAKYEDTELPGATTEESREGVFERPTTTYVGPNFRTAEEVDIAFRRNVAEQVLIPDIGESTAAIDEILYLMERGRSFQDSVNRAVERGVSINRITEALGEGYEVATNSRGEYIGPTFTPDQLEGIRGRQKAAGEWNDVLDATLDTILGEMRMDESPSFKEAMDMYGFDALARAVGGRFAPPPEPRGPVHSITLDEPSRQYVSSEGAAFYAIEKGKRPGERPTERPTAPAPPEVAPPAAPPPERAPAEAPSGVPPKAIDLSRRKESLEFLLKVYPENTYIQETPDGYLVEFERGGEKNRVLIRLTADHIQLAEAALEAGHGVEAIRQVEMGEAHVPGATHVWADIPYSAVVHILADADPRILIHEHWHVIRRLGGLVGRDIKTLEGIFPGEGPLGKASEEVQADAFADWLKASTPRPSNTLFNRILNGLQAVKKFFVQTEQEKAAEKVFRKAIEGSLGPPAERMGRTIGQALYAPVGEQAGAFAAISKARQPTEPPLPPELTRRIGKRFAGAPNLVRTEGDIRRTASRVEQMAREGEENRYWFEDAAKEIRKITQGNKADEEKFIQLLGIFSPDNNVGDNWVDTVQAWDIYKSLDKKEGRRRIEQGEKVIEVGRYGAIDRRAERTLFFDEPWSGLKTNNFYGNLSILLFPDRPQGVTVDRHMYNMLGYFDQWDVTKAGSDVQYKWAEALINHVAKRMGWKPWQVQAASWAVQRGKGRGPSSFVEAAREQQGAIGLEAVPHRASGHPLAALASRSYDVRRRYTREMQKAFLDENGVDELAAAHGLLRGETVFGPGYYQNEYNPGWHVLTQLVKRQGSRKGGRASLLTISPGGLSAALDYAHDAAVLLRQESAGIVRPFPTTRKSDTGVLIEMGKAPTPAEMKRIISAIPEDVRSGMFFDYNQRGLLVHNLSHQRGWYEGREIPDREFDKIVHDVVDSQTPSGVTWSSRPFQSVSKLVFPERGEGAWDAAREREAATAGRPAVRRAYDRVLSRIEAVNDRWIQQVGGRPAAAAPAVEEPSAQGPRGEGPPPVEPKSFAATAAGPPPGVPPGGGRQHPRATGQPLVPPPLSTGRATGQPPRVEQRVQDLQESIDEQRRLGIPARDLVLDRDTRRTWNSLDPEIREAIRDWDDDRMIRTMQRRNLDDVETQAMDAVVRGRKEAKDLALLEYNAAQGTPNEPATFDTYSKALINFLVLDRAYVNDGTGMGRALAARARIMAAQMTPDRTFLRQILKDLPGISEADAAELVRLWETGDPRLSDAFRAHMAGNGNKFWTIYKANLMGLPSEFANIAGNSITQALEVADTAAAAGVDWVLSKILRTGRRERYGHEAAVEAGSLLSSIPHALGEFARERLLGTYRRAWTGESRPIIPGTPIHQQVSPFKSRLGRLAATPLDALGVADDVFQRTLIAPAVLRKLAYRKAVQSLGQTRGAAIDAEVARIIDDVRTYPERNAELIAEVKAQSERRVYREKPAKIVTSIQHFVNNHKWINLIAPFIKTPANITRYAIRHSPFALREIYLAQKDYRAGKISQGDLADIIAPRLTGTLIAAGMYGLARMGMITGNGPKDPKDRKVLQATGWQPYSIVLPMRDGKKLYVPYSRFDPVAQIVGIAADTYELGKAKDINDAFSRMAGTIATNLSNRTFLRGLSDFGNAYSNPQQYMGTLGSNIFQVVIPGTVDNIARAIDPVMRDVRPQQRGILGFPERLGRTALSQVPFASRLLPPRYTATGEEALRPGGGGPLRVVSPIIPSVEKEGKELEEILGRLEAAPGETRPYLSVQGFRIPLKTDEMAFMARADKLAADELRRYVRSGAFRRLPDTVEEGGGNSKEAFINRVYSKYRTRARQRLLQMRGFRQRARDFIQEARQKGETA